MPYDNKQLLSFIQRSPTPFHVVQQITAQLFSAGFKPLNESDTWTLVGGQKYFVTRNDSSIIAFTLPADRDIIEEGFHMVGAHTDSPCLKVKPDPVVTFQGYYQVGVEIYGGVLLNPWFDRDLSLAGRVSYRDTYGSIRSSLINFVRPIGCIPSLAIHLDREANNKRSINAQEDMLPVLMQVDQKADKPDFRRLLKLQLRKEQPEIRVNDMLDYELSFYDTQPPTIIGLDQEFISSARLDNLLSCHIGLMSLLNSDTDRARLLVCNDHEEIGSTSACGARGPFLESVLQRIAGSAESKTRMIDRSMMISCDSAHGIHPNYPMKHDRNHGPILNHGPVIKTNVNQRYATSSETSAVFRDLCKKANVPVQVFVTRADMACGSTIGPITASETGVKTIDAGIAQFAMHSIREICGARDPAALYQVLCEFFRFRYGYGNTI